MNAEILSTPSPLETPPEVVQEIVAHRDTILAASTDLVVASDDDFGVAGDILRAIMMEKKAITARVEPTVRAANAAHKAATALRATLLEPAERAEKSVKAAMAVWVDHVEGLRREARRIEMRAEAERVAEARRAEAERVAEEGRRLAEAAALEAEGRHEEAASVIEAATAVVELEPEPAPVPELAAPKSSAASIGKTWTMRIDDKPALVAAWLAGTVPEDLVQINQAALNQIAKSMKAASRVPGCVPVATTTISGRAGV